MNHQKENIIDNPTDLRLMSINEARQILGIRYEYTKKLIDEGKLKSVDIKGRKKTNLKFINEFLESNSNIITHNKIEENTFTKNSNNLDKRFNEILERNQV